MVLLATKLISNHFIIIFSLAIVTRNPLKNPRSATVFHTLFFRTDHVKAISGSLVAMAVVCSELGVSESSPVGSKVKLHLITNKTLLFKPGFIKSFTLYKIT